MLTSKRYQSEDEFPIDWSLIPFGDIVIVAQYGLNSPSNEGELLPMLRMNNLQNGRLDTTDLVSVRISEREFTKFVLYKNDLLVNRTNSYELVGKTALFTLEYPCVFASYLVRFQLDLTQADPHFINYWFNYHKGQQNLKQLATKGVSQANINPTILQQRFMIPLPPLPEQRKIAEILSAWDEAIDLTEQLITAKQQRKQALMQQLLTGKVRFPEFIKPKDQQVVDYGELPVDWEYTPIGSIAEQIYESNSQNQTLPVLSCTKHEGLVSSLEYFGRQMYSDALDKYKVVRRHQFAYATNHIEEGSIGYQNLYDTALISPMYTVFQGNPACVQDGFLYRVLKTEHYRQIFAANTNGSVNRRGSLRWKEFSHIKVPLPSIPEQKRISDVIDTFDEELSLHQQKLAALRQQKKGLMQQLLTGKLRMAHFAFSSG